MDIRHGDLPGKPVSRRDYLYFNAITPIRPVAVEAMRPFLADHYGICRVSTGRVAAKGGGEKARGQVAGLLDAIDRGGLHERRKRVENDAIKGIFFANRTGG